MKFRGPIFFSLIAIALSLGFMFRPIDNSQKEAVLINTILTGLDRLHYSPQQIDDNFSEKVFDLYLDRLDGSRRFFTRSDYDQLEAYKYQLDDQAKSGTFEFFDLGLQLIDQSLDRTQTYYRDILAEPFDFSVNEKVETDGDKKPFAKDQEELQKYWFRMMKYETLQRLVDKLEEQEKGEEKYAGKTFEELEEESRKDVLKVYDDWYTRLRKLKRSDRMSDYLNTITNVFDPHTGYYEPIDKENFDISMSGRLEGIGARLQTDGDYTKVVNIVPGGPAWKGKDLEENDVILKVAQEGEEEPVDITGMQINEVVSLIRGKKDTKVTLTVKKVDGTVRDITILRDVVILEEGFAKSLLLNSEKGEKIGYIKLPRFYADFEDKNGRFCSVDVAQEIDKLKEQKVQGIILDLRNNGGGSLRDVVKMSGLFIEEGPIVQVKSRNRDPQILEDNDPRVQYDGPLIVMVNEFSASASEILAAALQDYGRAIIVGSKSTFGKGTVQRFYDLDRAIPGNFDVKPLGQIKLTTQKFYRVDGGSTQLRGVTPDIILPDSYQFLETGEKENDFPLAWSEIEPAEYRQNVFKLKNLPLISHNSEKRVKMSEAFQLVEKNAIRLKKQREMSEYPISLEAYREWDENLKEEADKYKEIFQAIDDLSVANLPVDLESINKDESKKARNDDWIETVKKDSYIYESLAIMHDLLQEDLADVDKN